MLAFQIGLLAILFALSAFFSGSETILFSLTSVQRARIRARSKRDDARIGACLDNSSELLSTLLVGNTFVNFAIATLGYALLTRLWPHCGAVAAVPVFTALLLLLGEITPKRLALRYAEELAPFCAAALAFWRVVLTPFNRALGFAAARIFAPALERERRALSDAELVSVIEAAVEQGDMAANDAEMIAGVLRLSELHANDEMTPRVDIVGIDSDLPGGAGAETSACAGHRFLPVFRRSPDVIEGVFDSRTGKREEALFVPEQITLDDLLVVFCKSGKQLAVVLDEYGGTAGIITRNDVLELIMGPSVFGADAAAEPEIKRLNRNTWEMDARASLDEVNRLLGLELEAEDADRIGGWVAAQAERIPHVGQILEADGCRVTILKRRKRRVTRIRLEVLAYPETDSDADLLAETDEQVEKTEEENRG